MKINRVKGYVFGIILITFMFASFGFTKAIGVVTAITNMKTIVVMDASSSMNKTDPNSIRLDAFKLLVDMSRTSGDKMGLVAYGHEVIKDTGLKDLNTREAKDALKKESIGIKLSNKTDIGQGLKRAVNNLVASADGLEIPLIVLLSDGKNDPLDERKNGAADKDINEAIELAKQKGIPIYTVGLNADGTVDENLLKRIADETGGKSSIINTAWKLPKIFGEVFAERTQSIPVDLGSVNLVADFKDFKIEIPDNVAEANIAIMSDNAINGMSLFDGDGNEVTLTGNDAVKTASTKYTLIKIVKPKHQTYTMKLKGAPGKTAEINAVYNYDLQLSVNYSTGKEIKMGDAVKVKAALQINGAALEDAEFYKEMKGKLFVKDTKTGSISEAELVNTGTAFEGEYKALGEGNYELSVRLEGKSLFRDSDSFDVAVLSTAKPAPAPTTQPEVKDPSGKAIPWNTVFMVVGGILALVLLVLLILMLLNHGKSRKKNKNYRKVRERITETAPVGSFSGQLMIGIRNPDEDENSIQPFFRKLDPSLQRVTLHHLLSELPEYKETENIIFIPGSDKGVIVRNSSDSLIEKNLVEIIKGRTIKLENEDKITITLARTSKVIHLQYFAKEDSGRTEN